MTPEPANKQVRTRIGSRGLGLLAIYAISGIAALSYEIAWFRDLNVMFGSTAYASSITLSAFMTGLGLGSILGARIAGRTADPMRTVAFIELSVAVMALAGAVVLRWSPVLLFDVLKRQGAGPAMFFGAQFVTSFGVMLAPTMAMGASFPVVMEAVSRSGRFARWAGLLYAANTAGGIAGAVVAGFLLVPLMGTRGTLMVAAALSALASALFLALHHKMSGTERRDWGKWAFAAAAVVIVTGLVPPSPRYPLTLAQLDRLESSTEWRSHTGDTEVLFDKNSPYSRVIVEKYPDGLLTLRNGALVEGSTGWTDGVSQSVLAALPSVSAAETSNALVVGLGTGYTAAAMLDMDYQKVRTVEINPAVVGAAEFFVLDWLSSDPRWELAVGDARADILTREERYDVITSEPSWPLSAACAPLFTLEFMQAAASRLTPRGAYCQWVPDYLLADADLQMMYKTMREVFPRVDVWVVAGGSDIAMVGFMDAGGPQPAEVATGVEKALANTFWPEPDFASFPDMHMLETGLHDPDVPINSDHHSRLEYRVVWNLLRLAAED